MDYELKRNSRSKKLSISVRKNGKIVVVSPPLVPKFLISKFIDQNKSWIETQKKKVSKNKFIDQDFVMIFGKKYEIKLEETLGPSKIELKEKTIIIKLHSPQELSFDPSNPPAVLTRFLKNTAQHYITKKTNNMSKKMGLSYGKISFRSQRTRWGSCSSLGNLNFNINLIHFPPLVIDYVIIHELAHRKHMDHSRNFWQLVEKYQPDYRLHRGWLKRRGSTID
jgi:predicted metal-dependent hydrolase